VASADGVTVAARHRARSRARARGARSRPESIRSNSMRKGNRASSCTDRIRISRSPAAQSEAPFSTRDWNQAGDAGGWEILADGKFRRTPDREGVAAVRGVSPGLAPGHAPSWQLPASRDRRTDCPTAPRSPVDVSPGLAPGHAPFRNRRPSVCSLRLRGRREMRDCPECGGPGRGDVPLLPLVLGAAEAESSSSLSSTRGTRKRPRQGPSRVTLLRAGARKSGICASASGTRPAAPRQPSRSAKRRRSGWRGSSLAHGSPRRARATPRSRTVMGLASGGRRG